MAADKIKTPSAKNFALAMMAGTVLAVSGCSTAGVLSPTETFKQGYVVDEDTLALVPPGSSREQVLLSLGTPTTINTFDNEVFYYISQTRKRGAQFMKARIVSQRVLAVYFGSDGTVERIADYGLQDGKVFDFVTKATPTGGKDTTFLGQILTGALGGPSGSSILGGN